MRVGLVAHFADIGLVGGVHVHVLLAVAAVGKASVTAFKFTFERFLTCKRQKRKKGGNMVRTRSFLEPSSGRRSARRSSRRGSADWGRLWHLFFPGEKWRALVEAAGLGNGGRGWGRAGPEPASPFVLAQDGKAPGSSKVSPKLWFHTTPPRAPKARPRSAATSAM